MTKNVKRLYKVAENNKKIGDIIHKTLIEAVLDLQQRVEKLEKKGKTKNGK